MPVTSNLSYAWYDTPNIHFCTIADFVDLAHEIGAIIDQQRGAQSTRIAASATPADMGVESVRRTGGVPNPSTALTVGIAGSFCSLPKEPQMPANPDLRDFVADAQDWRRDIHAHPELLYDVPRTAKFVADRLHAFGCDEVKMFVGKSGVVGVINGRKSGG